MYLLVVKNTFLLSLENSDAVEYALLFLRILV